MARKNIFETLSKKHNFPEEIERLYNLLENEETVRVSINNEVNYYSIDSFVNGTIFKSWINRGTCLDYKDMKSSLGLGYFYVKNKDIDGILNNLEFIANILNLAKLAKDKNSSKVSCDFLSGFNAAEQNLKTCLDWMNYEEKYFKDKQCVIIVEKNEASVAVAEILDESLSYEVLKYNHFKLKGDVETKKTILLKLADKIESKKRQLQNINKNLGDDVFFLLNNLNIRHNNCDISSKEYKKYISEMEPAELEKWYDETYQMILLSFLLIDNVERARSVKLLKSKISESEKSQNKDLNTEKV